MSVAKSFFDITTGRSHGVVPTSDAVRIVLDAGAILMLDRTDGGEIRARAAWGEKPSACVEHVDPPGDLLHRSFSCVMPVTGDRVDKALSALVEKLLIGESGVDVTEWTVPSAQDTNIPFGRFVRVPLFAIDLGESDDAIAKLLLKVVEAARRDDGYGSGHINAVVVRVADDDSMVGIGCMPEKPEPPVGATLTGRRMVGGSPWADAPWDQVAGKGRVGLVRRAIDRVRRDCELAGLDVPSRIPKLFLVLGTGVQDDADSLSWAVEDDALARIVDGIIDAAAQGEKPVALRVKAVRRPT